VSEVTLGGYIAQHDRAPAFSGSDGRAYSVALWVADEPDDLGRLGGALLFIRWNLGGTEPDGHLETDWIVRGDDEPDVRARLGALSLYDVKAMLDEQIAAMEPGA
jgi:hypothetical protein